MTTNGLGALALVEVDSNARGYLVMDGLAKRARVTVRSAYPVTPGKFLILFAGEVASIEEAMEAAEETAGSAMLASMLLPQVHPALLRALAGRFHTDEPAAIAIVEMRNVAKTLEAADLALKEAQVGMLKLHLASGIGGKGYFVLVGDLADLEAAVLSIEHSSIREALLETQLIPNPQPDIRGFFS